MKRSIVKPKRHAFVDHCKSEHNGIEFTPQLAPVITSSLPDGLTLPDLKKAVVEMNQVALDNWDDPKWRREMAQELTDPIYLGFEHEDKAFFECVATMSHRGVPI